MQGGGGPAEPVLSKQSVLPDAVKSNCHAELVSASVRICVLPVSLDRSRNKFGMTVKEISSLRAVVDRVAISLGTRHCLTGSPRAAALAMTERVAFTMAEILLSLTIIGVVAAITLPSLTGNINERTWNTQRKALYARFSQALPLMPALNGYGTLTEETDSNGSKVVTEDNAAETFITSGLSKVMKINNICDSDHLFDCGVNSSLITLGGSSSLTAKTLKTFNSLFGLNSSNQFDSISLIDTKAAAFETQNGESIIVYYNPRCVGSLQETPWGGRGGYYVANKVCANFVYDLNGTKGPNTVGKDIGFITVMYPSDIKVVAPVPMTNPSSGTYARDVASKACTDLDSDYRLPNSEEGISMFVNKNLLAGSNVIFNGIYWTSSKTSTGSNWVISSLGELDDYSSADLKVWCVKR